MAFHLTLVAITVPLARRLGCWVVEGALWNQPLHGVCREAGANVMMRKHGPSFPSLEVVADGLPLHHGAQLAIDTTMVSPLRKNGGLSTAEHDSGWGLVGDSQNAEERRYPELSGQFGRSRLVVLACEVGGQWSEETRDFLRHLAKARARGEPFPLQRRAEAAWLMRWRVVMACSTANSFALSSNHGRV